MTARKIEGAWWVDFHYERTRYRKKSPVDNKRGAEEYERILRERLLKGEPLDGKLPEPTNIVTVGEFLDEWLATYSSVENKPSEQKSKEYIIRLHLKPFFGATPLGGVTEELVAQFKAVQVKKGLTGKTINNHLTVLRKAHASAKEWKRITEIPDIKRMPVEPPAFDFLVKEESQRLLDATPKEHLAIVNVGLKAGLRRGEILALKWEDIDFVASKINVRRSVWEGIETKPKGGRFRDVDMSPKLAATLKAHRHLRGAYVFCNEDGSRLTKDEVKRILEKICKQARLRMIGWKVLRHTFASQLTMDGVPLKVVQELLGHTTIEMTMRYAHLAPSSKRLAVATLDAPALRSLGS